MFLDWVARSSPQRGGMLGLGAGAVGTVVAATRYGDRMDDGMSGLSIAAGIVGGGALLGGAGLGIAGKLVERYGTAGPDRPRFLVSTAEAVERRWVSLHWGGKAQRIGLAMAGVAIGGFLGTMAATAVTTDRWRFGPVLATAEAQSRDRITHRRAMILGGLGALMGTVYGVGGGSGRSLAAAGIGATLGGATGALLGLNSLGMMPLDAEHAMPDPNDTLGQIADDILATRSVSRSGSGAERYQREWDSLVHAADRGGEGVVSRDELVRLLRMFDVNGDGHLGSYGQGSGDEWLDFTSNTGLRPGV